MHLNHDICLCLSMFLFGDSVSAQDNSWFAGRLKNEKTNWTALMYACAGGHKAIAELLLRVGAKIHIKDSVSMLSP